MKKRIILIISFPFLLLSAIAVKSQAAKSQPPSLQDLQQSFVNLRFGMFIHFNIPIILRHRPHSALLGKRYK